MKKLIPAEDERERRDAFKKDLIKVYDKHKMFINGCGCCGSPWIGYMEEEDVLNTGEKCVEILE